MILPATSMYNESLTASFFQGPTDDRLPAMERVVALEDSGQSLAIPFSVMEERKVMALELSGDAVVVFWSSGTASAVDAGQMAAGRDVGSTAVYSSLVGERRLTFEAREDGTFRDRVKAVGQNPPAQVLIGDRGRCPGGSAERSGGPAAFHRALFGRGSGSGSLLDRGVVVSGPAFRV